MLSTQEITRYSRHLLIPNVGTAGQLRLKNARVLVVGCGGLGSPALLYLAAAGVGTIGLIDNDRVDESNLQRQILFSSQSVGQSKVEEAVLRLQALNPHVRLMPYECQITSQNALAIVSEYDVVLDGSDNFATRYLLNDACVLCHKPLVYGAIYRFEGQVSVFNAQADGINYRDLFPTPPPPELAPNCAEAGVLGVLPGIIGCVQANEVLKICLGIGEPLAGKLWLIDTLTMASRVIKIPKPMERHQITELIDYEQFCDVKSPIKIQQIAPDTLHHWQAERHDFWLVDVREPQEYELDNLRGKSLPLSQFDDWYDTIPTDTPVVVHCQSGKRSAQAIEKLLHQHPFNNLYNLTGGLTAYRTHYA